VDCGLAQGGDYVAAIDSWPVAPGDIDFVFLTHAHIDHIGRMSRNRGQSYIVPVKKKNVSEKNQRKQEVRNRRGFWTDVTCA
jgi:glyoxylase-like metal-dependent hydrolase (beta-lactamase superfamily II)